MRLLAPVKIRRRPRRFTGTQGTVVLFPQSRDGNRDLERFGRNFPAFLTRENIRRYARVIGYVNSLDLPQVFELAFVAYSKYSLITGDCAGGASPVDQIRRWWQTGPRDASA